MISVITPSHGRPDSLRTVLDGLAAQDQAPDFEVVVVLDGPDATTASQLAERRDPFDLRVEQQARRGPAAARNRGLELAAGKLALFLDDDVIPGRSLLAEHRVAHGDARDQVVIGPLLAPTDGAAPPWTRWEWSTLADQYEAMTTGLWPPTPRQFYTGNASVATELVAAAGGFNEDFRRGEDVELAWRLHDLGARFVFRPAAESIHLARRSYGAWLAAAREYGRTDVMLERARSGADVPRLALEEFAYRHRGTRRLALASLRHPWLLAVASRAGEPVIRALGLVSDDRAREACSAMFTMAYWAGVADLHGDRWAIASMLTPARGNVFA